MSSQAWQSRGPPSPPGKALPGLGEDPRGLSCGSVSILTHTPRLLRTLFEVSPLPSPREPPDAHRPPRPERTGMRERRAAARSPCLPRAARLPLRYESLGGGARAHTGRRGSAHARTPGGGLLRASGSDARAHARVSAPPTQARAERKPGRRQLLLWSGWAGHCRGVVCRAMGRGLLLPLPAPLV